ncbi:putative Proteasome activator pa28 beta subunit [Blattamonas nauphoetae]|uniref:Proteasome activator pa28 beta subunit n=1 Tax=Blattamonas nauphoetae TaxID=2049346 RepID=A0ABQ9X001_9EUKA|nr:putative Proteasome activator pa28 beta subunit [Blattamonas nauphoetae]
MSKPKDRSTKSGGGLSKSDTLSKQQTPEQMSLSQLLKAKPEDLGDSLVKPLKDAIFQNSDNLLMSYIPEKIQLFRTLLDEVAALTTDQVKQAVVLPSMEELRADLRERKVESKKLIKERKKLIQAAKIEELKAKGEPVPTEEQLKDEEDDGDEPADTSHAPKLFVQSKLHIPCNTVVDRLINISRQIKDDMNKALFDLRIWLRLSIPSLLEGDNLGSEVVSAHVDAVSYNIDCVSNLLKDMSSYHLARMKLLCQITEAPYNEDLRSALTAMDVEQFNSLRQTLPNVVNVFVSTYDAIGKNIRKIKMPRLETKQRWLY